MCHQNEMARRKPITCHTQISKAAPNCRRRHEEGKCKMGHKFFLARIFHSRFLNYVRCSTSGKKMANFMRDRLRLSLRRVLGIDEHARAHCGIESEQT